MKITEFGSSRKLAARAGGERLNFTTMLYQNYLEKNAIARCLTHDTERSGLSRWEVVSKKPEVSYT